MKVAASMECLVHQHQIRKGCFQSVNIKALAHQFPWFLAKNLGTKKEHGFLGFFNGVNVIFEEGFHQGVFKVVRNSNDYVEFRGVNWETATLANRVEEIQRAKLFGTNGGGLKYRLNGIRQEICFALQSPWFRSLDNHRSKISFRIEFFKFGIQLFGDLGKVKNFGFSSESSVVSRLDFDASLWLLKTSSSSDPSGVCASDVVALTLAVDALKEDGDTEGLADGMDVGSAVA
eukprot:CAMPEP_0172454120 /NCGR_PEP_ID=MMETSP1065-20121228/11195_1 /TAXON_ID=265537 /ORGANISM="Amphiprora paludosa, Strain CCMP125" /LENGTH=231 /DNA_ID=CAMNT_0013206397 /DNA_START=235 /DNA_END=932 /DNA_ORIENTATION=-